LLLKGIARKVSVFAAIHNNATSSTNGDMILIYCIKASFDLCRHIDGTVQFK